MSRGIAHCSVRSAGRGWLHERFCPQPVAESGAFPDLGGVAGGSRSRFRRVTRVLCRVSRRDSGIGGPRRIVHEAHGRASRAPSRPHFSLDFFRSNLVGTMIFCSIFGRPPTTAASRRHRKPVLQGPSKRLRPSCWPWKICCLIRTSGPIATAGHDLNPARDGVSAARSGGYFHGPGRGLIRADSRARLVLTPSHAPPRSRR